MASSSLGLNSSPPNPQGKYDAFMSFTGEGVSKFFRDTLCTEFKKIERENQRTAITILEENYASSSWALDELELILESHGKRKTVLPIFYNVDPSDVRNQTGSFAEAFAKHEETYKDDPDKIRRWRAALTQVATSLGGIQGAGTNQSSLKKLLMTYGGNCTLCFLLRSPLRYWLKHRHLFLLKDGSMIMCFRGKDTRLNIVDHMYASLEQKGITTFRDDKRLERGQSISSGIVKAIDESQISLVTLSKSFASSTWCLDELVKILECTEKSNLQTILEAFTEHEEALSDMVGIKCNTRDRKISKVSISVHYDGEWVSTAYVGGKTKEIVVSKDITFEELLGSVYRIVGIDPYEYEIIMKTTDDSKLPAQPVDDEDLSFFIEQSLCLDKSSKMNILKPRVSSPRTTRKINKLRLLVNYDGKWGNSIYIGGKTKGIMVSDSITYEGLVQRLYHILEVDPSEYKIIITTAYGSKLPTQPVELIDDDDLTFFIDESLSLDEGSKIPLCITLQRRFYRWHLFSSSFCSKKRPRRPPRRRLGAGRAPTEVILGKSGGKIGLGLGGA
ncbi:hypothetical protein DVH24_038575 [Malus domestica]|uniref:ADP-ribosyl cyclase/cyclic ADP-ribose hydrolase n=1 Tax=Malus domestica TaxID=3750 RepID=A0A498K9W2_MALDO|nr:hypothetical protein DVH24_038575 [Malus domestica]